MSASTTSAWSLRAMLRDLPRRLLPANLINRICASAFARSGMRAPVYETLNAVRELRANVSSIDREMLNAYRRRYPHFQFPPPERRSSLDPVPWDHPYLTEDNLRRFRKYSETIWDLALEHHRKDPRPLRVGFTVNMAQNVYKWARLAREQGVDATLIPHPWDTNAQSMPEWEEFDGVFHSVHDGAGFLRAYPNIPLNVACRRVPMTDEGMSTLYWKYLLGDRAAFLQFLARYPSLRHEALVDYGGEFASYLAWAMALAENDVVYAASVPYAAYLSGRPYCFQSVGGDLHVDCGRADHHGEFMSVACAAARFITFTNPYTVSYCRRLGFVNGLYHPYPMDDHRYCPGEPKAREQWRAEHGGEFFLLATARIDNSVKGNGAALLDGLAETARQRPQVRLVFIAWGENANEMRWQVERRGLAKQFIFLLPAGKQRLIDYYRSCDAVLDQFTYGYYGATGLEAASVGKPIVMRIREHHYGPFYHGDVAPVENVHNLTQLPEKIVRLIDEPEYCQEKGRQMRAWLIRNHGAQRTAPRMVALLRFTADRVPLPPDLTSPLRDPLTPEEVQYHEKCWVGPQGSGRSGNGG